MADIRCPKCGQPVGRTTRKCPACGFESETAMQYAVDNGGSN